MILLVVLAFMVFCILLSKPNTDTAKFVYATCQKLLIDKPWSRACCMA